MQGLMQDTPLTLAMVAERAGTLWRDKRVATKTADGVHRASYGELLERVSRLASALVGAGMQPGDRVASFAWNSQRHLELYLAVPCAGGVLHTLNPRLRGAQVAWIIDHAGDSMVFVDRSLGDAWAAVAPHLSGDPAVITMDDTDGGALGGSQDYEEALAAASATFDWPRLEERDAAAMCYTSGTTGDPKGVVYSHRSAVLHALASMFADSLALTERDVLLPIVPQFHVNAWGTPYAALMTGANLAMPGRFMADPAALADLVEAEQVTVSAGVPTVWFGVLQAIRAGTVDRAKFASLKRLLVGGSAVPEALMTGWDELGVPIVHAWGMTETSPVGTVATVRSDVAADQVLGRRLSQGLPLPTLRVRITSEAGDEVAWDGQAMGELEICGPWIADAYYDPDQPDGRGGEDRFATDEAGTRWLRTGDVATIDPSGYVTLVDRTKDLVKSGGEWISTVELENLLIAHPKVAEAAVIAVPHPKWDERPLACVVVAEGEEVTADELRDHLREHVASWQVPDEVAFVEEVPKTSVGKFDKKVLRARFADPAGEGA